jgi:hypothetical protein
MYPFSFLVRMETSLYVSDTDSQRWWRQLYMIIFLSITFTLEGRLANPLTSSTEVFKGTALWTTGAAVCAVDSA